MANLRADFVDTQPMHGNAEFGYRPSRKPPGQPKSLALGAFQTTKLTLIGLALVGSLLFMIRH